MKPHKLKSNTVINETGWVTYKTCFMKVIAGRVKVDRRLDVTFLSETKVLGGNYPKGFKSINEVQRDIARLPQWKMTRWAHFAPGHLFDCHSGKFDNTSSEAKAVLARIKNSVPDFLLRLKPISGSFPRKR